VLESGKPVLTGNCQIIQFGKTHTGYYCMFVCQADFSDKSYRPVLASFVFDRQGRVIDSYFGNSAATPSHITQVHDGTRASFGDLPPPPPPQQPQIMPMFSYRMQQINDQLKQNAKKMSKDEINALLLKKTRLKEEYEAEAVEAAKAKQAAEEEYAKLLQTPRWGCTSVLKGPLDFFGCQRRDLRDHHSVSLVDGYPYVECVTVSAGFDAKFDTSPQEIVKITPYFKYDPLTGNTMYGASGSQFYDGYGFGNRFGAQGFQSFVVSDPNDGSFRPTETRQGSCPYPDETPVPPTLSALNPNTRTEWERRLRKCNESLRDQMKALEWLETNPLVFPTGPIDSAFADAAFGWVRELSIKFQPSRLSLSSAAMAKMLASRTHASIAAMHQPAMRAGLFKGLTEPPRGARPLINSCDCNAMNHDPRCLNHLCPFKHTRLARLQFEWPPLDFASGDPAARLALEHEILEAARASLAAATAKQKAAEAAAEKQRAADATREAKNARARQATALRKEAAAAALASAEVAPAVASRKRKTSAGPASASAASAAAAAPWSMNMERSNDSSPGPASAGPAAPASTSSRKKRKGGAKSKSKSKSKRRLRK